ncbi:hypothetical protein Ssi03_14600 [Sphaerisporangium siamense]|uniref:Uncharacterized protein n=1 Tax=Sphaerisporangium siamense TaxID=795645 RepID=A0A7W7GBF9_9ACTN|nr:MFS transporter [Sphaerisporangium siamense]MBB4702775.1 hypothetical protein [Sphaerisporangium siamense]GII83470.1 hypothetical protein Ssi03_14600 [Sphaerisporangium siamense]
MTAGLTLRLARAVAFAVVCLGLSAVGHLAGGGTVSPRTAVLGAVVALAAALPATGRERGTGAVLALLTGAQAALHVLFSTAPLLPPLAEATGHTHAKLVPDLGMALTHGWAIVMTALWLSRGEAALWAMLRRLAVRLLTMPLADPPVSPRDRRIPVSTPSSLRSAALRHVVIGRAPPSQAA